MLYRVPFLITTNNGDTPWTRCENYQPRSTGSTFQDYTHQDDQTRLLRVGTLLYLYYFNKLLFDSSLLLNFLHFTLLDIFCIFKLFYLLKIAFIVSDLLKC